MPRYRAIHPELNLNSSNSDMISLEWSKPQLAAEFRIPGDPAKVVRVEFDEALIFRVLDEMALSTEPEPTPSVGLVPENFAYEVEGAVFVGQFETFLHVHRGAKHYRFITGWTCLDVLSKEAPRVNSVSRPV